MSLVLRSLAVLLAGSLLFLALPSLPAGAAPSGPPIRIGGTLALTGPLGTTAIAHKIAADIWVEQTNRKNGLLGRPVEYVVLDDQSKSDLTRSLYERLITVDKVDLVMGAHATAGNLAALSVAQRYGKIFLASTMLSPQTPDYNMYFPAANAIGPAPEKSFANKVLDALASTGRPPKTIALLASKFPSVHFISVGAREVMKQRGVNIVLDLEYEFGTRDFGPIAARVKAANPDFLWIGAVGVDGVLLLEALRKLDYTPKGHFVIFPAPAPMAQSPDTKYGLAMSLFEPHPPFTDNPVAAEFVKLYTERATKAGLPYPVADHQAALGYTSWQVLEAAITGTKSLDDKVLAQWLKANPVNTIIGKLRYDCSSPTHACDDLYRIKQVQGGRWVSVWPKEWAAPGAKLIYPAP